MAAYNTYNADLAGSSFANILTQTEHILGDNVGFLKFCEQNATAIKSGGLKDMRVYRTVFLTKYMHGKSPAERAGFLGTVAGTAVVQTKSRVLRVIKAYHNPDMVRQCTRVLGDFRDKRSETNDIDTFLVVNLRTAFPEIVMLVRMVSAELVSNTTYTDGAGAAVNIFEWERSPCYGQLALDPVAQANHKNYMQYFWTNEVTGPGAKWDADSAAWYDRTTATDAVELPAVAGITCAKSGVDPSGAANTRYTIGDIRTYATALRAHISGAAAVAAGNPFA